MSIKEECEHVKKLPSKEKEITTMDMSMAMDSIIMSTVQKRNGQL